MNFFFFFFLNADETQKENTIFVIRFTANYGRQQSTETPKRPLTTTVWDLLRCVRLFFGRTLSFQGRVPAIFFLLAFTCERKTPLDARRLPVVHHTHRPSLCVPSPWTRTVPESLSPRQDYRNPSRAARSRPDEPQQQSIARIPFIPRASYAVSSLSLIRRVISWRRARKPFLSSTRPFAVTRRPLAFVYGRGERGAISSLTSNTTDRSVGRACPTRFGTAAL